MKKSSMNVIYSSIFIAALLLPEVTVVPSPQIEGREITIELLSEESNPDARVRREADSNLPDHLSFQVPLTKGEVTLRMKRARLIPTVTSHSYVTRPFSQNAAVYTDVDNGASAIVRRDDGQYSVQGSFLHDRTEWHLKPLTRSRRRGGSGTSTHTLHRGAPKVQVKSFAGDAIVDDEPPVEILSLADRNRHRLQRLAGQRGKRSNVDQREVNGPHENRENNVRNKRDTTQHIVEMAFVVDYADYEKWVAFKGASNAVTEMTMWYTYVAEQIDIRYRTISDSDIAVGTRCTFLKILTTASDDDFIEDLISSGTFDGGAGLEAFRTWYQEPANGIPNADHYMLFTGFDIQSATGVAYTDRVCTVSGVSITENDFTAGVGPVAAHELGHSLSAEHDATTGSCSDSTSNIMAAIFSIPVTTANRGNPWRFSSCSISSIKSYLSGVTCTEPSNTGTTDALPAPTGNDRPGIVLDRDDQCKQFFRDNSSSYCSGVQASNGGEENLCGGMFCEEPSNPSVCTTMLPQEYTTCGTGKWCRLGYCLDEGVEPTNPPPGDGDTSPENIFDCIPFLLNLDFFGLLSCIRDVLFG